MALFRNVGPKSSIAPGATHFWQYWFGNGAEVGVVTATPNMLLAQINTELVARDPGVFQVESGIDEGGTRVRYTIRIHNQGAAWMDYNLNVGYL
jgi:phosphoserine phosphatase